MKTIIGDEYIFPVSKNLVGLWRQSMSQKSYGDKTILKD
jgi:hypothetical protein